MTPAGPDWSNVSEITWMKYSMEGKPLADSFEKKTKFPREAICLGCHLLFLQKSRRHLHCDERCRWKKAVRHNTPAAQRARERFRLWYASHKGQHIANVTARKKSIRCHRKESSSSLHTQCNSTELASTAESLTSELCMNSSLNPLVPISSSCTTAESNTGEAQNQ